MRDAINRSYIIVTILIAVVASSCDIGSAVFTEEELDAMYSIKFSQDSHSLASGSQIVAAKSLEVSISSVNGAPEPSSLDIVMTSADGTEIASLIFATKGSTVTGAIEVEDFDSGIPPFTMPADVPDGYYTLDISLKNQVGESLAESSTVVLVFGDVLQAPSLVVYPGTVSSGKVSLLKLESNYPAGLDPWIRWSINGKVQAEGLLSTYADRLAWKAPSVSGVYEAKAEIYPFVPPVGVIVPALVKAEIKLPVSATIMEIDPLGDLRSWSILSLDGNFDDLGPRPRIDEPSAIGKPYLETYPSGFGYLLNSGSGIASRSSLVPTKDGLAVAFTAIFVMAPASGSAEGQSGSILACTNADKTTSLVIGIENGYPYVESGNGKTSATLPVPIGDYRLAVAIVPSAIGASIAFYIDEVLAGRGDIATSFFSTRPDACVIAGEGGYNAIYDDIHILSGPYPAYRVAAKSSEGSALIAASAFEGGELGSPFETSGTVAVSDGALTLESAAALIVGKPGLPDAGATLSFDIVSGEASVSVALADDAMLVIGSDGSVSVGKNTIDARLDLLRPPRVSVALESTGKGLRLFGATDEAIDIPSRLSDDARWVISATGGEPLVLTKIIASTFEASIAESRRDAPPRNSKPDSLLADGNGGKDPTPLLSSSYVSLAITE